MGQSKWEIVKKERGNTNRLRRIYNKQKTTIPKQNEHYSFWMFRLNSGITVVGMNGFESSIPGIHRAFHSLQPTNTFNTRALFYENERK